MNDTTHTNQRLPIGKGAKIRALARPGTTHRFRIRLASHGVVVITATLVEHVVGGMLGVHPDLLFIPHTDIVGIDATRFEKVNDR